MLLVTGFVATIYIILLFMKKYPVSLSMYWTVVFFMIYVFVPTFRSNISLTKAISIQTVEQIASISLIGLLSFIFINQFFLLKWESIENVNIKSMVKIPYKVSKRLLFIFAILFIMLMFVTIGADGVIDIFSSGSSKVWLDYQNKNILVSFAELSPFYLAIIGTVLVLSAKTAKEKRKSYVLFSLIILIASTLVYARRHIIYPIFTILFYYLSRSRMRTKILKSAIIIFPLFFIVMFLMGYYRTYGVTNFSIQFVTEYFKNGRFIDIFIENTDFSASYYFLSRQIEYGAVKVSPLGYLKVLFAPIPRFIWASKPQYTSVSILSIIEPLRVSQGFSAGTGYIGEALATCGIPGIIMVSALWGLVCGFLDKKYHGIIAKKTNVTTDINGVFEHGEFTLFEYFYLYTGALLITESHRGDFGAASVDFVLEIALVGLLLMVLSKRYINKTGSGISANTVN